MTPHQHGVKLTFSAHFHQNHMQHHVDHPLPGTRITPRGKPAPHIKHSSVNAEVVEWLLSNVGKYRVRWNTFGDPIERIWFLRNSDAVLFKLTWM